MKSHLVMNHKPTCTNSCNEGSEEQYKVLKDNYERLIDINKRLQEDAKDKEYAMDVQIAELREGYEKATADNIKLQDDLSTQNKLWKMWLEKCSDKEEKNGSKVAVEAAVNTRSSGEEMLLIEDDDVEDNN